MNHAKWFAYFKRNKQNRPEPDWDAPINVPPTMLEPMLRSIEEFRLGDGGGPASLLAYDAEGFRNSTAEMRTIVDLWFAEEAEHARLLGCAVRRFGGRIMIVERTDLSRYLLTLFMSFSENEHDVDPGCQR
jgi:hypothetical protein